MVLIGLGANIPSKIGSPVETLEAALTRMGKLGIEIERRSRWYQTSPVPASAQPDYVNGVVAVRTSLGPEELLATLHKIEADLGRTRRNRWEARAIDLDILSYHEVDTLEKVQKRAQHAEIPHPRLHERRFVLVPLAEIAPNWRHPCLGKTAVELLAALTDYDRCEVLS